MNLNYKSLASILGLQKWIDRLTTVEASVTALESAPPVADGNGVYDGSGTAQPNTLITRSPASAFGIGTFPSWPFVEYDGTEKGISFSDDDITITHNDTYQILTPTYIQQYTKSGSKYIQVSAFPNFEAYEIAVSNGTNNNTINIIAGTATAASVGFSGPVTVNLRYGTVTPNGNITGRTGDIYLFPTGGAGNVLWIKESGNNTNTGWVAK